MTRRSTRRRRPHTWGKTVQSMEIDITYDLFMAIENWQAKNPDAKWDWKDFGDLDVDDFASDWETTGKRENQISHPIAFGHDQTLNLCSLRKDRLPVLKQALYAVDTKLLARGTKSIVTKFMAIQEGKTVRASGAKQMHFLMEQFIALNAERFWFWTDQEGQRIYYCTDRVRFHKKHTDRNGTREAYITLTADYTRMGSHSEKSWSWRNSACRGKTPQELLELNGLFLCTEEDCEIHDTSFEKYKELATKIGTQVTCNGRTNDGKQMFVNGNVSILVVDVLNDKDEDNTNSVDASRRHTAFPSHFWAIRAANDPRFDYDFDEEDYEAEQKLYIEVPVHPDIKCFDLRRHERYDIHRDHLEVYEYDKKLAEKLVLEPEVKELIELLADSADNETGFVDIVAGKTGGVCVLLAGPPGTGKTLTAEIYSEAIGRPLYRVQCSQLGTNPDTIETALLATFRRCNRWGANMLIDEADVYISERGGDLAKNAIVGVFLRTLEYQECVLFMSTNLPESVDDAIASRCIARIDYDAPERKYLSQIWDILSNNAGLKVNPFQKGALLDEFPYLCGRDVKNILKLIFARKQTITLETVRQAARFHPNRGNWYDKKRKLKEGE